MLTAARGVGDFRSDAALFPNYFGQTCQYCIQCTVMVSHSLLQCRAQNFSFNSWAVFSEHISQICHHYLTSAMILGKCAV